MPIFIIDRHIPLSKSLLTTIKNIVNNLFLECDFAQLLGFASNTSSIVDVVDIFKKSWFPQVLNFNAATIGARLLSKFVPTLLYLKIE
jgi:hypothetical protein